MADQHDGHALASGDYLSVVRDFALSRGIQASDLLDGSNLDAADFIHPPELVSNLLVNKIGQNLYARLENPLRESIYYGLQVTPSSHGSLGIAIQSCSCLRDGLDVLEKYYNTRLASQNPEIIISANTLQLHLNSNLEVMGQKDDVQRFFDLSTMVSMVRSIHMALGKNLKTSDVPTIQVNASEPANFPFEALPFCQFTFDAPRLAMHIPTSWLDIPFESANEKLKEVAIKQCEDELRRVRPVDLIEKVRIVLRENSGAPPSIEEIAELFFMSVATFKRRLSHLNSNYLDIKNEIRLERAEKLLKQKSHSMESIADELGFSDSSNFTKFFKKLNGETPKQFRNRHFSSK